MASHSLYRPTHRPTHRTLLFHSQLLLTSSRSIATRPSQRVQEDTGYVNPLPTYARSPPSSQSPHEGLARITNRLARSTPTIRARALRDLEKGSQRNALERQQPRRWTQGDVYAPHDLSAVEAMKRKRGMGRAVPERDVFDLLGINPLDEYKNVAMMAEFCGPTGRIKHRRETGLRSVNQRRVARAIRRAVGMGLLPSVHAHPEIVERERRQVNRRWFGEKGGRGLLTRGWGMERG